MYCPFQHEINIKNYRNILHFFHTKFSNSGLCFTLTAHPNSDWPHFQGLVATYSQRCYSKWSLVYAQWALPGTREPLLKRGQNLKQQNSIELWNPP